MNKYGNRKTLGFDSKKEAQRYGELLLMQKAKHIRDLKTQVRYELIPSQRIGNKVVERACHYVADFDYYTSDGVHVVEDVKSPATRTKDYIIKRKLMLLVHGIRIREVLK